MNKIKVNIISVEVLKAGKTNGKNWTLYKVKDDEGKVYTTFEKLKEGDVFNGLVEEKVNGQYKNLFLKPFKSGKVSQLEQKVDKLVTDIYEMKKMLEEIHATYEIKEKEEVPY